MTAIQKVVTRTQLFVEKQNGYPVLLWLGRQLYCVPGSPSETEIVGFGADEPVNDRVFIVRLYDYKAPNTFTPVFDDEVPESGDVIESDGIKYALDTIKTDISKSVYRLICRSKFKGAAIR